MSTQLDLQPRLTWLKLRLRRTRLNVWHGRIGSTFDPNQLYLKSSHLNLQLGQLGSTFGQGWPSSTFHTSQLSSKSSCLDLQPRLTRLNLCPGWARPSPRSNLAWHNFWLVPIPLDLRLNLLAQVGDEIFGPNQVILTFFPIRLNFLDCELFCLKQWTIPQLGEFQFPSFLSKFQILLF